MTDLTVVIATYNRHDMLVELLQALRMQTVTPKIIVMDDGSNFALPQSAWAGPADYKFDSRPHTDYQRVERYNSGVAITETPYVLLLDDDCLPVTERWAEAHLRCLQTSRVVRGLFLDTDNRYKLTPWFSTTNLSMPTKLAQELGPFDMAYNGKYGYEDLDLDYTLRRHGIPAMPGEVETAIIHRGKPYSGDREVTRINEAYYKAKWNK